MNERASSRAALGLGSNVGDRLAFLQSAIDAIASEPGVQGVRVSPVYQTTPVGGPAQGAFLNAVAIADTTVEPSALLSLAQRCEQAAGRERGERWGPRTLDVDILAVADVVSNDSRLTLPHPLAAHRAFVLVPWADVDPEFLVYPGKTVRHLLAQVDVEGVLKSGTHVLVA